MVELNKNEATKKTGYFEHFTTDSLSRLYYTESLCDYLKIHFLHTTSFGNALMNTRADNDYDNDDDHKIDETTTTATTDCKRTYIHRTHDIYPKIEEA